MKSIIILAIVMILSLAACGIKEGNITDKNSDVDVVNTSGMAINDRSETSSNLNDNSISSVAQVTSSAVVMPSDTQRLDPDKDYNLGGIDFFDDKNSVIKKLGEPIKITTEEEGFYGPSEILGYENMLVTTANVSGVENGRYGVMSIETTSEGVLGPRGIEVGDNLSVVLTSFSLDSSLDLLQTNCSILLYGDDSNLQQDFCRIDFSQTEGEGDIVFSSSIEGIVIGLIIEFHNQKVSSMNLFEAW